MINEKKSIDEIIKFIVNERKPFIIIAIILIIILILSIFYYYQLIKAERSFFQNRIIANYNAKIESSASFITKSILGLKIEHISNINFFYSMLNQLEQNSFINFSIIFPIHIPIQEITEKEIEIEKNEDVYLGYITALQAFENNKLALAESYLLENIQTKSNFIYITLESYKLLIQIYLKTKDISQLYTYSIRALSYIIFNNIKTPYIFDLLDNLYKLSDNENVKKSIIIQAIIFSKLYSLRLPDYFNLNEKINLVQKFIVDYLTSQSFLKEYLVLKSTVNNFGIHFFSLLDQKNSIFIYFLPIGSKLYPIIYSFDIPFLSKVMEDNYKTYEFKFSIDINEFIKEKEGYTLFKVSDISIGTYRKLYISMYVRNSELLGYLSQQRYRITNIAFLFLVFIIFVSITILFSFTLKEFKLNKLKSDFISIVSHELKTPITAIQLMLETIIDRYDSLNEQKKLDYLKNIFKETERLLFLINNLLVYSRSEKNKQFILFSQINIKQVLIDVIEFFKIDKKSMKIYVDFPENDIIIEADNHALKQVFYNIIDNAYKYGKDHKKLEIFLNEDKNNIKIKFKDNGVGISSKELPFIFEKFYRGSETNFIPGTGIGLSLTKSIIEMHQGKITVNSTLGVGTEFTIILPKKQKNVRRRILNDSKENLVG